MNLLNGNSELNLFESKKYGNFKIIEYQNCNKIKIEFLDTGYSYYVQQIQVLTGNVKDKMVPTAYGVGYLGGTLEKQDHKAYNHWRSMLRRCYGDLAPLNPAKVCKDWFNFQAFLKWFNETYPTDKEYVCLDKDKHYNGKKLYSPDTCCWLEIEENSTLQNVQNEYKIMSPDGEILTFTNQTAFAKEHNLRPNSINNLVKGIWGQYKGWRIMDN